MGTMRLLLIRHAQTTSNVDLLLDTAVPGADLTDLGRAQAEAVPAALEGVNIDLIVVSDLVRTHQTAEPLARARGLTPWVRGGVREISAGELEMRGDMESLHRFHRMVAAWETDLDSTITGGETGRQMLERYDGVLDEVHREIGDDGTAVVFSHGAVMRTWSAMRVDGVDMRYAADNPLANTALIDIAGQPGGWTLDSWGHVPLGEAEPLASRAATR